MKRYIDTELWQKQWYMNLSLKLKLLVRYMYDNCDCVGVFDANWRLISFLIGEDVCEKDIVKLNDSKPIIEKLSNGKFFIIGFVSFQYGELTTACKPHIRYIEELKKHGLFERVCKGYAKGINTLEEQEKEQEKEKEGLLGEIVTDTAEDIMQIWNLAAGQLFNNKIAQIKTISSSRKDKLKSRLKEKAFDIKKILDCIKDQPFLLGDNERKWKVSFDWVIENDKNYLKVLEGNYGGVNVPGKSQYAANIKK